MAGTASATVEELVNAKIAEVLRTLHPQWGKGGKGRIVAESTRTMSVNKKEQPDIVVWHPSGQPVVIETEYDPASQVEKEDARPRLGKTLEDNEDNPIEQVIALCIPTYLRDDDQADLEELVRNARYKFCLISERSDENPLGRWPEHGWIEGGIRDLATFIENTSLSERLIRKGMEDLIKGVSSAASIYLDECDEDIRKRVAAKLHQPENEQTAKMAMAIVANAFTFQSSVVGKNGIKSISQMKRQMGSFKDSSIEEWGRICCDINFVPIFDIAIGIIELIDEKTAEKILNTLSKVASRLATHGATSQHDFSGRLFQRLISDRKFLATFYTLPESAALLAELAISRLETNWQDRDEVTSLKVGDFACGTGALLSAAYGSIISRARRGGGGRFEASLRHDGEGSLRNGHHARGDPPYDFRTFELPPERDIQRHQHHNAELRKEEDRWQHRHSRRCNQSDRRRPHLRQHAACPRASQRGRGSQEETR